jgi:transcriptional regulator with XRE-family HTH domain
MEYDAFSIGMRALSLRENKYMKQTEISKALGIHQATYSKFENGRYDMPISEFIKLCNYLDVSVSWMVGENNLPYLTESERIELDKFIKYLINKRSKP